VVKISLTYKTALPILHPRKRKFLSIMKQLLKKMGTMPLRGIDKLMDRLAPYAGAVGLSQIPNIIGQYVHELSGNLNNATENLAEWEKVAEVTNNGDLAGLVNNYLASSDPKVMGAGEVAQHAVNTFEYLKNAYESLANASVWMRPVEFLRNMDADIMADTWENFQFALPADLEGITYGAIGIVLGTAMYAAAKGIAKVSYKAGYHGSRKLYHAVRDGVLKLKDK
jgi:hypothetical protein